MNFTSPSFLKKSDLEAALKRGETVCLNSDGTTPYRRSLSVNVHGPKDLPDPSFSRWSATVLVMNGFVIRVIQ